MILVDTNLLLYAEDSLSEHHVAARTCGMRNSAEQLQSACAGRC